MPIAAGASARTIVIPETTYGVTPTIVAGDTAIVPYVSNTTNLTRSAIDNPTIRGNRTNDQVRTGNSEVAGDLSVAYTMDNLDVMLESLFYNAWTANVLTIGDGSTQKSFTMELGHVDIGVYRVFTGMISNNLSLDINTDGLVNATFGLTGKGMTVGSTSIDSAPTAAVDVQPVAHFDGTFSNGGLAAECITSLTLDIDNGIERNYCLGSRDPRQLSTSNVSITGTVSIFFQDATQLNNFLNETEIAIQFTLVDPDGNQQVWLMNKCKLTTSNVSVADAGVIPITFDYEALDDGTNTPVKITRS